MLLCSTQSPAHKYFTSNYKDPWRRAEPEKMGCSQAASDSQRQKLARSSQGRCNDAAKHHTGFVFGFFPSLLLELAAASLFSTKKKKKAKLPAWNKCFCLQLRLPPHLFSCVFDLSNFNRNRLFRLESLIQAFFMLTSVWLIHRSNKHFTPTFGLCPQLDLFICKRFLMTTPYVIAKKIYITSLKFNFKVD